MSFSDRQVDLPAEGFDLAVRIGTLTESSLIARKLTRIIWFSALLLIISRQAGEPVSPEELKHHATVAYIHSGRILKWRVKNEHNEIYEVTPSMNHDG